MLFDSNALTLPTNEKPFKTQRKQKLWRPRDINDSLKYTFKQFSTSNKPCQDTAITFVMNVMLKKTNIITEHKTSNGNIYDYVALMERSFFPIYIPIYTELHTTFEKERTINLLDQGYLLAIPFMPNATIPIRPDTSKRHIPEEPKNIGKLVNGHLMCAYKTSNRDYIILDETGAMVLSQEQLNYIFEQSTQPNIVWPDGYLLTGFLRKDIRCYLYERLLAEYNNADVARSSFLSLMEKS